MSEEFKAIVQADTDQFIDICVGPAQWKNAKGHFVLEEDFKVGGEIWRVHKSDADPYPSNPHAHCIGGSRRYVGYTLHLGTAELFNKRKALGRYLLDPQFEVLLAKIRPKFPHLKFPLVGQ